MKQHSFFGWALILMLIVPAYAITVCHDYTLFRITENNPRFKTGPLKKDRTSVEELRAHLESQGYKRFPYTNAAENPEKAGSFLKPGDVIILRDDHSGYVSAPGRIDHFIQVFGASGTKYDAGNLPSHASLGGKVGGLYLNETLKDFLCRPFYKGTDRRVEVWRPSAAPK